MAIEKLPSTGDMPRNTGVPDSLIAGGSADSAGTPWQGRTFEHHDDTYAADDGSQPEQWAATVTELRAVASNWINADSSAETQSDKVNSLAQAQARAIITLSQQRLLVPLVAEAGDFGVTTEGAVVEKTQELSIVTVASPDGRRAMPVFSSVETMRQWNAQARPVPMPAPQIALAAASEGIDIIIVDAASPQWQFGVRRTQLEALALAKEVLPAWADAEVIEAVKRCVADDSRVREVSLAPGDPSMLIESAETIVRFSLNPGLTSTEISSVLEAVKHHFETNDTIVNRIDSIRMVLT